MTTPTPSATAATSKAVNARSIGVPNSREMKTRSGATNSATWVLEPTATANDRSILFFAAIITAAPCSAALPTIGMMMTPRKNSLTPSVAIVSSVTPTRISDSQATRAVATTSMTTVRCSDQVGGSCSASGRNIFLCVFSEKSRLSP